MFKSAAAFSSFSINDLAKAQAFYAEILGLAIENTGMGLSLKTGGTTVFMYEKSNHAPATFTVLNFEVDHIDKAVDELLKKGIQFEHYDGETKTDENGILRGIAAGRGPDIAWFKDPSGNIISVLQSP